MGPFLLIIFTLIIAFIYIISGQRIGKNDFTNEYLNLNDKYHGGEDNDGVMNNNVANDNKTFESLEKISVDKSNTINEFTRKLRQTKLQSDDKSQNNSSKNEKNVSFLPMVCVRTFDKETREIMGKDRIKQI